jgi:multicomponent Na+:H+ antiporter subunit G
MMITIMDILSIILLGSGSLFLLIGCLGLLRFPDFFTRLHAAGLIDTLASGLILGGLIIESGWTLNIVKILFILLFLFFTSPASSHSLAKAALTSGLKPWHTKQDESSSISEEKTSSKQ